MKTRQILLVMAFALLLAACNSRQKAPSDEVEKEEAVVDSQSVGNCYDQLVIAEALVEVDPDFSSTDDYTKARENYDSIMGIYLKDLDENEAAIRKLEVAKKAINTHGRYFATHTDEMQKPVNQRLMATYGRMLKEIQMTIVTLKLTDSQKARVDSINNN